jgi:hypothetical protein
MHDYVLAVATVVGADRRHRTAATGQTIAGTIGVDVAGVETIRAMIPVPAAGGQHTDKGAAVAAAELLNSGL